MTKRKNRWLYLFGGLTLLLVSCVRTEADLFDESAALRINRAVASAKDLLVSSENGWAMEYFPTNEQAGVTFLIRFDTNETATVATVNEYVTAYTERSGSWDVIADTGPVLTFNTYIDIFHLYSDPSSGYGQGLGVGLEGDYEFIIMNQTDDWVQLKGKKRGTEIILKRLDKNQDWKAYFDKLSEVNAAMFHANLSLALNLSIGDKVYALTDGFTHVFTAASLAPSENAEAADADFKIPFIVTLSGIRLAKALELDDRSIQTFQLSGDKSCLYEVNDSDVKITASVPPVRVFADETEWQKGINWYFDNNRLGGAFVSAYANLVAGCAAVYKEDFQFFYFKYRADRRSLTLSFKSGTSKVYEGAYDFDISLKSEANSELEFIHKGTMDKNGELYANHIPGFKEWFDLLTGSTYVVTTDTPLAPSVLKFTSTSQPDNMFILIL